jgi:cytochrome d ubiquinol oxidase subunit I
MTLDPLILSRLQFFWVIAWHILLPAFTIGLASYIAFLEGMFLMTRRSIYLDISLYWTRIFSVSFGMGVVSGIVMPFQLGTNWSRFAEVSANVISPMLAYEGLTAFFLEAAFLGVLLFGRKLIPPGLHFFAALMVALGTLVSSFWILSVNSFMQTPAGYEMIDDRLFPRNWMSIVFNPSFPYRLAHTIVAFYVTTGFVVLGLSAWLQMRDRTRDHARAMMNVTLWLLTILVPLQILIGDLHGLNTREHQPAKIAAIEARWDTMRRAPITLFAWPDEAREENRFALDIPVLGSLILAHDANAEIMGLKDVPRADRPPVLPPFFGFRIMVGIGLLMLTLVAWSLVLRARDKLFASPWFLRICLVLSPLGFVAVIAGWVVTETGRQPWTIYGVLRTAESVTPSLTTSDVIISFAGYMIAYLIVFPAGILVMARLARNGPTQIDDHDAVESGRPATPIDAAQEGRR